MDGVIMIVIMYVIPTILAWKNNRKLAIITGIRVDYVDLFSTFFPVFNIIAMFVTASEINNLLPQERTLVERIFAIKQSDYWKKDGDVD